MSQAEALVLDEIRRIARDELRLARVPAPEDDLARDLGLDSTGLIQLAVELEDRFHVILSNPDAASARTVAELCALVAAARQP
jgi:acyl carrier protein